MQAALRGVLEAAGGHLAQVHSICHSHKNELGPDNVLHASTVQLADNCAAGVGKHRLHSVLLVSHNPVLLIGTGSETTDESCSVKFVSSSLKQEWQPTNGLIYMPGQMEYLEFAWSLYTPQATTDNLRKKSKNVNEGLTLRKWMAEASMSVTGDKSRMTNSNCLPR